ncbi:MAG TPA: phosphatase PAP2 family protein [Gaiellales bacterium]|nr:phosphatase PAP2 family protein [Gaiellales bacterium]
MSVLRAHRRTLMAAGAYVVLALLVNTGVTASVDRFALRHLRPLAGSDAMAVAAPASFPATVVLVTAGLLALWLRGRSRVAAVWGAALAAGFVIELVSKELVDQIRYAEPQRVLDLVTLSRSFPSGHSMRALMLAGIATTLWPRVARPTIAWALATAGATVVVGMHVPSDAAGGLLAGAALWSWADCYAQARATQRT